MKIMLLAQFYPPTIGGEERHVQSLARALTRRHHDVTVVTQHQPGVPAEDWDQDVRVCRIRGSMQRLSGLFSDQERPHAPPFPDPELMLHLRQAVRSYRPDVIHAHNWLLNSFLPLKRRSAVPLVVTLHDYSLACSKKTLIRNGLPCSGPALGKCLMCASLHYGALKGPVTTVSAFAARRVEPRLVDQFLVVSHAVAAGNGLRTQGIPYEVIPNFLPSAPRQAADDRRLADLPEEPYLLFVGDLRRLKGIDLLVRAYAQLEKAPPLVLIGRRCPDTPQDLPPNIRLFESWPHHLVLEAWRRCLFGLAPSQWSEPFGIVIIEAMSMGKPVIGSKIGGIPDIIDHEVDGLLIESGDTQALVAAMTRLVRDNALRDRLGRAAYRRARAFSEDAVVSEIENVYVSVAKQNSTARGPVGQRTRAPDDFVLEPSRQTRSTP